MLKFCEFDSLYTMIQLCPIGLQAFVTPISTAIFFASRIICSRRSRLPQAQAYVRFFRFAYLR